MTTIEIQKHELRVLITLFRHYRINNFNISSFKDGFIVTAPTQFLNEIGFL